jgi:hypothetical protein
MPTSIEPDELPPVVGMRLLEWLRDISHPTPFVEIEDEPGPATD